MRCFRAPRGLSCRRDGRRTARRRDPRALSVAPRREPWSQRAVAARREPWSQRAVDGACAGFAVFTLACHATVWLGGSLRGLVALLAALALLAAAALVRARRRARAADPELAASGPARPTAGRAQSAAGRAPAAATAGAEGAIAPPTGPRALELALAAAGALALVAFRSDAVALWATCVAVLAAAAALRWRAPVPRGEPAAGGRGHELALFGAALACALVALAAHRPDPDDAFYASVAAAAADAPEAPLLRDDSLHGVPGLPVHHPAYRLQGLEVLAGAVAWLTGLPALAVLQLGIGSVGALLVPLATARLFRLLTPATWPWSVAAVLVVLVAVGDAHRWYGNFALVRIWQGKSLLLSVLLPLVFAYAIEFGLAPTRRRWLRLAAAQIAALGASASGVWAAPLAAAMGVACAVAPDRRSLRTLALGALASLYLAGAGLWLQQELAAETRARAAGRSEELAARAERRAERSYAPGVPLEQTAHRVLGDGPLRGVAVAASALVWALLAPGLAQRFAIAAPLGALLLFEPHAARAVAEGMTGPSYWRLAWVLPLPALLALGITAPLRLAGSPARRRLGRAGALGLGLAFALAVPRQGGLAPGNGVRLGAPGLKVPPAEYRAAERLVRAVPPGSLVLAPPSVSLWVPTLRAQVHPLFVRGPYLRRFRPQLGEDEIVERTVSTLYVAGERARRDANTFFERSLLRPRLRAVALRSDAPHAAQARALLEEAGFRRAEAAGGGLELWVRGPEPGAAR